MKLLFSSLCQYCLEKGFTRVMVGFRAQDFSMQCTDRDDSDKLGAFSSNHSNKEIINDSLIHTYVYMYVYVCRYINACMQAYIHTYIYTHTYICTYRQTNRQTDGQVGRRAGRQTCRHDITVKQGHCMLRWLVISTYFDFCVGLLCRVVYS